MPRKEQGWITCQSSDKERRILEQICQQTQRTKTEILREMIRQMGRSSSTQSVDVDNIEFSEDESEEGEESVGSVNTATLQVVQISARNILKAKVKRVIRGYCECRNYADDRTGSGISRDCHSSLGG